jgi:hypothetical protein
MTTVGGPMVFGVPSGDDEGAGLPAVGGWLGHLIDPSGYTTATGILIGIAGDSVLRGSVEHSNGAGPRTRHSLLSSIPA